MTTRRRYVAIKCDGAPKCTRETAVALEWIEEVRVGYMRGLGWERRGLGWRCPECVRRTTPPAA